MGLVPGEFSKEIKESSAKKYLFKIFIFSIGEKNAKQKNFETSWYSSQNGKELNKRQQMVEGVWRKGNPHPLLLAMQTCPSSL